MSTLAYARIKRAHCDLEILRADHSYIVHLTRKGERIATEHSPRVGRLTIEQVRTKTREGDWRRGSGMRAILEKLAVVAEAQ